MGSLLMDVVIGAVIGLTLGLLGGGGSILTVPALVYLVGQNPQIAVTTSLLIVGANSITGALLHRVQGGINLRVALVFGGVGMISSYLFAGFSKIFAPTTLMIAFSLLMLVVGWLMIVRKSPTQTTRDLPINWVLTAISGAGAGALTGFLGVGGGFLILPTLVMLVGLPIKQAVGTSLVIIAMNSLSGFLGHLNDLALNYSVLFLFVAAGMVGVFAGSQLAKRIKPDQLHQGFGIFVLLLAIFLLYDNLQKVL